MPELTSDKSARAVDLSGENVHWDLRESMSYADYLRLSELLACQQPLTERHDELLFVIIHQASELWMKLCLHEIGAAIRQIRADDLGPASKMMARVARVQVKLIQSWEILSTLTPRRHSRQAMGVEPWPKRAGQPDNCDSGKVWLFCHAVVSLRRIAVRQNMNWPPLRWSAWPLTKLPVVQR